MSRGEQGYNKGEDGCSQGKSAHADQGNAKVGKFLPDSEPIARPQRVGRSRWGRQIVRVGEWLCGGRANLRHRLPEGFPSNL